jgi:tRNA (Thr-GGU) A37 N-methylase
MNSYSLEPVGFIRSSVKGCEDAPRQAPEGAPDAWLEIEPQFAEALLGIEVGHELIVITWLHEAKRGVLKGHPRNDLTRPLTGRVLHALTGAAKPVRSASCYRA